MNLLAEKWSVRVPRLVWLLFSVVAVAAVGLAINLDQVPSTAQLASTPIVIAAMPVPPIRPPVASLSGSPSHQTNPSVQDGQLVGSVWLLAGTPTNADPKAPIAWPKPLSLASRTITVAIETDVPPVHIRLRLKQTPQGGVEVGAIEQNCWQRGWMTNGEVPDCVFGVSPDGQNTVLTFDLPHQGRNWYITAEGIWLVPVDGSFPMAELMPIVHAWWAFAVQLDNERDAD